MKIRFEIAERTFEIETNSKTQVTLNEIKTIQDIESKNYGKETSAFVAYVYNEVEALKYLNDMIPLTQENIETFEQLAELRTKVLNAIEGIRQQYNLKER